MDLQYHTQARRLQYKYQSIIHFNQLAKPEGQTKVSQIIVPTAYKIDIEFFKMNFLDNPSSP